MSCIRRQWVSGSERLRFPDPAPPGNLPPEGEIGRAQYDARVDQVETRRRLVRVSTANGRRAEVPYLNGRTFREPRRGERGALWLFSDRVAVFVPMFGIDGDRITVDSGQVHRLALEHFPDVFRRQGQVTLATELKEANGGDPGPVRYFPPSEEARRVRELQEAFEFHDMLKRPYREGHMDARTVAASNSMLAEWLRWLDSPTGQRSNAAVDWRPVFVAVYPLPTGPAAGTSGEPRLPIALHAATLTWHYGYTGDELFHPHPR